MISFIKQHAVVFVAVFIVVLLIAKFFYSLFVFDVPLGFDPGMYRYLFVKYAREFPPFSLPDLRPWAQEYPFGLFIITSYLIKAGIPMDWFLGWIWNLFPVILLCTYAFIVYEKEGKSAGVLLLLIGFLSIAFYDGFAQMYWKTYLSLLFLIISFRFFEKESLMMLPFAALTILSHSQTGLILGLTFAVWWLINLPLEWRNMQFRKWTAVFAFAALLGLVWYFPYWERAFWSPFKSVILLRGQSAPAGNFPSAFFFIKNGAVVFLLGAAGWLNSLVKDKKKISVCLWQIAPAVCAVFIVFRLVFYNRFFLQLDFFLMYFAATYLKAVWRGRDYFLRAVLIVLVCVQGYLSVKQMLRWEPRFNKEELSEIAKIPEFVEKDAHIIALENNAAVWLLGWLPDYHTGGPGLFDFPAWTYPQWERFIYGSHDERLLLMRSIDVHPLYFMTSKLFFKHYGEFAQAFLSDPCFEKVEGSSLIKVVCRLY